MGNKFLQVIILWHFTILSQNEKRQCCRLTPPPDLILITFILGNIPSLFFVLSHPPSKVNFKYPTASFMTSITCHSPHPPHYFHWQNNLIRVIWMQKMERVLNNLSDSGTDSPIAHALLLTDGQWDICFWWSTDCGTTSVTLCGQLAPLIQGDVHKHFLMDTGG